MAKVTTVNDGDSGFVARNNWNDAMKTAETDASINGDGTVGNELSINVDNTCALVSDSPVRPPSVEAIKCYIDQIIATEASFITWKSFSFRSRSGTSGIEHAGGFYEADDADITLDQGSPSDTWGTLAGAYGSHFFIVAGDPGLTDGTDLILTVNGTSVDDFGVVVPGDSEILVADATLAVVNDYFETSKRWIGQVTFTLTSTAATAFSFTFNYGFAFYESPINPVNFQVDEFEIVGNANANDADFNVELVHHTFTGWVYSATNFQPNPNNLITSISNVYAPNDNIYAGQDFAFRIGGLAFPILSTEGILVRIITGTNNSVANMDIHLKASVV